MMKTNSLKKKRKDQKEKQNLKDTKKINKQAEAELGQPHVLIIVQGLVINK